MKSVVIKGKQRAAVGKKDAKKLRVDGNVPCVLYGGKEPIHFYAGFNEFRKIVYTPNTYLLEIDIDGKVYNAIMQDIQWHPVEEQIQHIDFLIVTDDKPIKIDIPVRTFGLAKGIKQGGKLKANLRKMKVKGFAKDLPDSIDIDVENLELGQNIKVEDLTRDNIEFLDHKSNVVVSVNITRLAKAAMVQDMEDAAAEAEEAAAAAEEGGEAAAEAPAES